MPSLDFDTILQPLGAGRFMAEYEGRKPLHLEGAADKFAEVMTFARLNDLLGQATIWSQNSLMLYLDKEKIQPPSYCAPAVGRDGGQVLRPDPAKVKRYLRQGATLIANDIDHLNAGLTSFSGMLEQSLGGKVQGNLYLSSKRRPGFAAHFDTHDVYAVHVEGTKTWYVYEGRATDPIAHPAFKTLGQEHHDRAKGDLLMEITMKPGDLLYLPRGQYHAALADEGGAVHIAFGVTYPIGLDVLTLLFDRAVQDPAFRANLPRPDGEGGRTALKERLLDLAAVLARELDDEALLGQVETFQRRYRYPRDSYDLPGLLQAGPVDRWQVRAEGIRLVEQGGRFGLLKTGTKTATEVPAEIGPLVRWVLERKQFSSRELEAAFPSRSRPQVERVVRDLAAMRLVAQAV